MSQGGPVEKEGRSFQAANRLSIVILPPLVGSYRSKREGANSLPVLASDARSVATGTSGAHERNSLPSGHGLHNKA